MMFLEVATAESADFSECRKITDSLKEWTVVFNTPVNPDTVTGQVYIEVDNANILEDVTVRVSDDRLSLTVSPPAQGYQEDNTYFLCITENVYSKTGKSLAQSIHMPFELQTEDESAYVAEFQLSAGWDAERYYSPAYSNLASVACSEDGTVFLRFWGSNNGVATLDVTNGSIQRINIPQPQSPFLLEGPNNTVIIQENNEIWMLRPDGSYDLWGYVPQELAINMILDYADDGTIYAMSGDQTDVIKLHPNGEFAAIDYAFIRIDDVSVRRDGLIAVSDVGDGSIYIIDADENVNKLVSGLIYNDPLKISFDPQGNLYAKSVTTGFVRVNLETGELTPPTSQTDPWVATENPNGFSFLPDGSVLFGDFANNNVLIWDMADDQFNYPVINRSYYNQAFTVGPDGSLYSAFSGYEGYYSSQIVKWTGVDSYAVVIDNIDNEIVDMKYDSKGGLYVLGNKNQLLYYASTNSNPLAAELLPGFNSIYLAVNPVNNHAYISGFHDGRILEYHENQLIIQHQPDYPEEPRSVGLAFSPDGVLYAYASEWENNDMGPVVDRWILSIDLENDQSEIFYTFPWNGSCPMGNLCCDSENNVWLTVSPDQDIIKLTAAGDSVKIADQAPMDADAIAADANGNVYITCNDGIFRFFNQ